MKNQTLLIFMMISVTTFGQIRQDQWMIGGNGFFSYSKSEALKFISLQLSPSAGYFFKDKFAGGLRLGFSSDTYRWGSDKFRISTKFISPFLRYYFLPVGEKVNFLADAAFGYSWSKYKQFQFPASFKYRYYSVALMAGPAVFLNERTALEITIGYNYLSRGPIDSTITHKFQVGIGLQVHIGKY